MNVFREMNKTIILSFFLNEFTVIHFESPLFISDLKTSWLVPSVPEAEVEEPSLRAKYNNTLMAQRVSLP
ncbi:hypothetical protein OA42_05885 [Klebsiella michiganensis]|nr:hypothetical protein OA42_05885 [Klebsiella michiganensis]